MSMLWSKVPALPAAVGLCAGILASTALWPGMSAWVVTVWVVTGFVLAGVTFWFTRKVMWALGLIAVGAGVAFGAGCRPESLPADIAETRGTATATIVKAKRTAETMRLVVHVDSWTPKGDSTAVTTDFRALVSINAVDTDLRPGARLRLVGKIHGLADGLDVPYQTDYNRYLHLDGVVARMLLYSDDYEVTDAGVPWLDRFVDDSRRAWLAAIADAGFDEEATGFMLAVLGGEDLLLGEDLEEDFRNTGLSHVLAISGLHVGIIVVILALLLYPIKPGRRLRVVYFISIGVFVLFYALVTGGSPSVCRAAVMCCVLMGYRLLEVRPNPFQSLAVTIVILLSINPLWLYLPGFQFSVAAVLAIITFAPRVDIVPRRYGVLRVVWMAMVLPVIAVVGTMALTVFYFHSFSLNFWVANVVASIFVPLLVGLGFVAALLSLVGLSPGLLGDAVNILYSWTRSSVTIIADAFPDSRIPMFLSDGQVVAIVACVTLVGWLVWHYSHVRGIVVAAVAGIVLTATTCTGGSVLPASELYVPRHFGSTDIIVVHHGRSYLWTSSHGLKSEDNARMHVTTLYRDFFAHRGVDDNPVSLYDGLRVAGMRRDGAVLTINGRTIAVIDSAGAVPPDRHVDIALISNRFNGDMVRLARSLDADSIILHSSINYSRHQKFVRQLDTLDVAYRSLRDAPLVWQFR